MSLIKDIAIGTVVFFGLYFLAKKGVELKNSAETKAAEGCGCGNGAIEVN